MIHDMLRRVWKSKVMNPSSFVLGVAFPLLVRSTIKRKALLRF